MPVKFTLKTETIKDGDNEVVVRGLSLNDIVQLMVVNRDAVEAMFGEFAGRDPEQIKDTEITEVAMNLIETAPAMVAHIIALAADATDEFDNIMKLPVGMQMDALEKVGGLTFTSGGGAKKMLALAWKMLPNAMSQKGRAA